MSGPRAVRREEERALVPPRLEEDAHKGDAGRVLCLCGSRAMPGAAILVARSAQRAGAGLVTVGCLEASLLGVVPPSAPEAVYLDLSEASEFALSLGQRADHAVVAGPGLGQGDRARRLVDALLASNREVLLVLDADALNLLAGAAERLRDARGPVILTPHPGEASRLLGREVPADPEGREASARELSARTGAVVCLKGRGTVVAHGELVYVNDTGNPGMATAGAGDVLAGILGAYAALCATGGHPSWSPFDAAASAVRVHGLAGDMAAAHLGRRGLTASDLVAWLPAAHKRLEG